MILSDPDVARAISARWMSLALGQSARHFGTMYRGLLPLVHRSASVWRT